ncbi:hypothetical protein [Brevibacillus sp. MER 51]|uniref:hypothetical protein n=1 Tax=Brevibacillus sp. MER 51 TaxID=2939560 RepID=UPI00203D1E0A|nr:hypothetical protein [Brevibacillus sp. MER 51]MCM3141304.1 hypothetical protein [Brevibacillus sp. MER 51]
MAVRKEEGQERRGAKQQQYPLIYVGPNIPGGLLMQYTVFRGGVPEHLTDLFEKQPAIRQLIVPVNDLAAVQERMRKSGTLEHTLFQQVKDGDK